MSINRRQFMQGAFAAGVAGTAGMLGAGCTQSGRRGAG